MKKNKIPFFFITLLIFTFIQTTYVAQAASKITLDKKYRAGCLACHSDPKIYKTENDKRRSLYINPDRYFNSVHKDRACLDCHTDWEFRTHKVVGGDYRLTAGLACTRCHKHAKQYKLYSNSIHARITMNKARRTSKEAKNSPYGATCGICHNAAEPQGVHYIEKYPKKPKTWKDSKYWTKFRFSADKICGQCHPDRVKNYNDYYHGRAYKTKEKDAPVCWSCHNEHAVFRKNEIRSTITEDNLPKTCGRCHPNPSKAFAAQYAEMIHGRNKLYEKNLILKYFSQSDNENIPSTVKKEGGGILTSIKNFVNDIIDFLFPENLREQKEAQK